MHFLGGSYGCSLLFPEPFGKPCLVYDCGYTCADAADDYYTANEYKRKNHCVHSSVLLFSVNSSIALVMIHVVTDTPFSLSFAFKAL